MGRSTGCNPSKRERKHICLRSSTEGTLGRKKLGENLHSEEQEKSYKVRKEEGKGGGIGKGLISGFFQNRQSRELGKKVGNYHEKKALPF